LPQLDECNKKQTTAPALAAYKSNFQTMHLDAFRSFICRGRTENTPSNFWGCFSYFFVLWYSITGSCLCLCKSRCTSYV